MVGLHYLTGLATKYPDLTTLRTFADKTEKKCNRNLKETEKCQYLRQFILHTPKLLPLRSVFHLSALVCVHEGSLSDCPGWVFAGQERGQASQ